MRVERLEKYRGDYNIIEIETGPCDRFHVTTEHTFFDGRRWIASGTLLPLCDRAKRQRGGDLPFPDGALAGNETWPCTTSAQMPVLTLSAGLALWWQTAR